MSNIENNIILNSCGLVTIHKVTGMERERGCLSRFKETAANPEEQLRS